MSGNSDAMVDVAERQGNFAAFFDALWGKCHATRELQWSRIAPYLKMTKYQIALGHGDYRGTASTKSTRVT